jgi:hypothetical protein
VLLCYVVPAGDQDGDGDAPEHACGETGDNEARM